MKKPFIIKTIRDYNSWYKVKFNFQKTSPNLIGDRCCYRCSISKDGATCKSFVAQSLCKHGTRGYFNLVNLELIGEDE